MEVLTNLIVVIISQYIRVSNNHAVHLKFIYMSIISPKSWKIQKLKNINEKNGHTHNKKIIMVLRTIIKSA